MNGDRFQIKFLVTWILLVAANLVLTHEALQFPVFNLTFYFIGFALLSLLIFLSQPTYSVGYVLVFLIPLCNACLSYWYLSDQPQGLILLTLNLVLAGVFFYYIYLADILTLRKIQMAFETLRRGITSRPLEISFQDERGEVLRELVRFMKILRDREILRQVISKDRWEEIKLHSLKNPLIAREKDVIALQLVQAHHEDPGRKANQILSELLFLCDEYSGFINQFHFGYVEIIFFEDSEGHERNALLMMRDLFEKTEISPAESPLFASLFSCSVKTGMIAKPEGYRHICLGPTLDFELNRLEQIAEKAQGFRFFVNKKLAQRASHIFQLDHEHTHDEILVPISKVKSLDEHLEKLQASRVEDKLLSIRVIQSQASVGPDSILPLFTDTSPRVRIEAIRAAVQLAKTDDKERIGQALIDCLAAEWLPDCRATIAIALGDLGKKEHIRLLFPLLKDGNDRVRANAIEAIGKSLNRKLVMGYLMDSLKDVNNRGRANAALAMWLMGEKSGFKVLKEMAHSEDALYACSGLYGIGEIFTSRNVQIVSSLKKDPVKFYQQNKGDFDEARQICEKLLFHEHPLVERNALKALEKIGSALSEPILIKKLNQVQDISIKAMVLEALEDLMEPSDWLQLRRGTEC